ncbi:hypothetical protein [Limosilactobacillus pontis]|nr:hypothetical protein [Limosilactobacillus pontis]
MNTPIQAAGFHQPRNRVYQVTYINAGAYQTKHQFAIFNHRGHVVYVDVEDIDAVGNPIVDDRATTIQRQAPRRIRHYLTNHRALNHAASKTGFVIRPGQRVRIQNRLIPKATTGRIHTGAAGEFTVILPDTAKYQTIQFKPAATKYQIKK